MALTVIKAADVKSVPEQWLWEPRIPIGITVVEGDPGTSKSTVTIDWAARVSANKQFHPIMGLGKFATGPVLLAQAEDPMNRVITRLEAAGADRNQVYVLSTSDSSDDWYGILPRRLHELRSLVSDQRPKLMVIDPLSHCVEGGVNSDSRVRAALGPLAKLAEEFQMAVVLVRHLTKSGRTNPLYAGAGSIAITGLARSALLFARDPTDPRRRLVAKSKNNYRLDVETLAFQLRDERNGTSIEWLGRHPLSAQEILRATGAAVDSKLQLAIDFLREFLATGPRLVNEVYETALAQEGLRQRTVERAKEVLGIDAYKTEFHGPWMWALPTWATEVERVQQYSDYMNELSRPRIRRIQMDLQPASDSGQP